MTADPDLAAARIAWLDGRFMPESEARIPALSSAVQHGMSLFETLRIARGAAPLWERHRARLEQSSRALGLPLPEVDWLARIAELAQHNGLDGVVRITIGAEFALIHWRALPAELEREQREGVALGAVEYARELAPFKTTSRASLLWLEQRAGGEVLFTQGGTLLETSRSNLFLYREGRAFTAPTDRVLAGVTRAWAIERMRARGVEIVERAPRWPLQASDAELFLSNAVRGIRRITAVEGRRLSELEMPLSAALQLEFAQLFGAQ